MKTSTAATRGMFSKRAAVPGRAAGKRALADTFLMNDAQRDPWRYHSDVQYRVEREGFHRDDVIAITNQDSIAREIERLRKTGKTSEEAAMRLVKEMRKTTPNANCAYCGSRLPKSWNPKGFGAAYCSKHCQDDYVKKTSSRKTRPGYAKPRK